MINSWQSSIARPDLADWVTTAAYVAAAALAARAAGCAIPTQHARERTFWRTAAMLLILLGANELLDLQTLLTSISRLHAKANGWYDQRRTVQYVFVITLGVVALLAGTGLLLLMKHAHPAVRLAVGGFVFIGAFVLLRAASIHHLEEVFGRGPDLFNLGSLLEMAGILVVAAAAAIYARGEAPAGD